MALEVLRENQLCAKFCNDFRMMKNLFLGRIISKDAMAAAMVWKQLENVTERSSLELAGYYRRFN